MSGEVTTLEKQHQEFKWECVNLIEWAEGEGMTVDTTNVVDFIADHFTDRTLAEIRWALRDLGWEI